MGIFIDIDKPFVLELLAVAPCLERLALSSIEFPKDVVQDWHVVYPPAFNMSVKGRLGQISLWGEAQSWIFDAVPCALVSNLVAIISGGTGDVVQRLWHLNRETIQIMSMYISQPISLKLFDKLRDLRFFVDEECMMDVVSAVDICVVADTYSRVSQQESVLHSTQPTTTSYSTQIDDSSKAIIVRLDPVSPFFTRNGIISSARLSTQLPSLLSSFRFAPSSLGLRMRSISRSNSPDELVYPSSPVAGFKDVLTGSPEFTLDSNVSFMKREGSLMPLSDEKLNVLSSREANRETQKVVSSRDSPGFNSKVESATVPGSLDEWVYPPVEDVKEALPTGGPVYLFDPYPTTSRSRTEIKDISGNSMMPLDQLDLSSTDHGLGGYSKVDGSDFGDSTFPVEILSGGDALDRSSSTFSDALMYGQYQDPSLSSEIQHSESRVMARAVSNDIDQSYSLHSSLMYRETVDGWTQTDVISSGEATSPGMVSSYGRGCTTAFDVDGLKTYQKVACAACRLSKKKCDMKTRRDKAPVPRKSAECMNCKRRGYVCVDGRTPLPMASGVVTLAKVRQVYTKVQGDFQLRSRFTSTTRVAVKMDGHKIRLLFRKEDV
ncbi:hypothetical protein C8J56DRAFT_1068158 [Mycena floridula]|nr:hypothetical protein C8J56DRAFT_1068158 [Mycena floridula]